MPLRDTGLVLCVKIYVGGGEEKERAFSERIWTEHLKEIGCIGRTEPECQAQSDFPTDYWKASEFFLRVIRKHLSFKLEIDKMKAAF